MSILINKKSRVIVQGFTGKEATFHSQEMINYGTNIVGGVSLNKTKTHHLSRPVFNSVFDAKAQTNANVSIIFVPAPFALDAILESLYCDIKIIVCITEGIPINDMLKVKNILKNKNNILIGPNCPGVISPNASKVGIMPGFIFKKGAIGLISRSGTLTYEIAYQINKSGYGISTAVGIGGDAISGVDMKYCVNLFLQDRATRLIIIIGEIGGDLEIEVAQWIQQQKLFSVIKKPILGFIAGQTAPTGRTMGHAGAIITKKSDSAIYKIKIMQKCGIKIIKTLFDISKNLKFFLDEKHQQ